MAGIFIQSVAFGGIGTAVGLAEDLQKGLIERFRALPMARSAVLAGRTTADLVRNVFVLLLMTGVGALVGFDFPNGALGFIAACALVLLFAYALLWGFAVIGLVASNSETAQVMAFPILFPLIFASPAFVPHQPRCRAGSGRSPPTSPSAWSSTPSAPSCSGGRYVPGSTSGHVLVALAWCVGLLAVLAPLAVWRYRRSTLSRPVPPVQPGRGEHRGARGRRRAVARPQRRVADGALGARHGDDLPPLAEGHLQRARRPCRSCRSRCTATGRWGRDVVT